jgi:nucleoside phosphorylase/CheY-like chemotaxis protein
MPRILIVDDDPEWWAPFKDLIETMGYDVDIFERYDEVKNSLKTTIYDLAFVDIVLLKGPHESAQNLVEFDLICRLLNSKFPKLPIVAVSGKTFDLQILKGLSEHDEIRDIVSKNETNIVAKLQSLIKELAPLPTDPKLDEPDYRMEDQPWYSLEFPPTISIDKKQIDKLKDDIDIVIVTATEVEITSVIRFLKPFPKYKSIIKTHIGPETYYIGKFGEYKAVITKCRMGCIGEGAVTLATDQAQRLWQPRAIIMVGIAFGKNAKSQKIGDVLVASRIIFYEAERISNVITYKGVIPPSNTALLNRFENAFDWRFLRPDGQKCNLLIGPILSGEKLINDPYFKSSLFKKFPDAIGGEMEGAGLCAASMRAGIPWILVKSICDWADGKKHDKHQPLAAAAAASLVHHVLSQKGTLDSLRKQQSISS